MLFRSVRGVLQNIFTENCDACLAQGIAHGGGVGVKGERFAVVVDKNRFLLSEDRDQGDEDRGKKNGEEDEPARKFVAEHRNAQGRVGDSPLANNFRDGETPIRRDCGTLE